jgi:hypothetical protein
MLTSLSSYSVKRENVHILDGNARNKVEERAAYERKGKDIGGIHFFHQAPKVFGGLDFQLKCGSYV